MATVRLKALAQTVVRHPWSSLQDILLVAMAMLVATLLALQYNLFFFISELSEPHRRISLAEATFLTLLLAVCIVVFILRRLYEERRDVVRQVATTTRLREFSRQASRDSLTDLATRRVMLDALEAVTTAPSSVGRRHAFFLIDLDDFKRVNDLHGHLLGDRVLQIIAQRFGAVTRPSDLLARLGGDEFALLCYDVERDTALAIARRLIASLDGDIRTGRQSYKIAASIGAALIPDDGTHAEEVIHHADLAMYRAKGQERSSVVFFDAIATYPQQIDLKNSSTA
jgi:diguanylate cyclase (GGDEF)-like protein